MEVFSIICKCLAQKNAGRVLFNSFYAGTFTRLRGKRGKEEKREEKKRLRSKEKKKIRQVGK